MADVVRYGRSIRTDKKAKKASRDFGFGCECDCSLEYAVLLNKAIGYLRASGMEIRITDIHRLTPLEFDHIGLKVAEMSPLSQLEAYMIMFPQETPQGPTETPQDDTQ